MKIELDDNPFYLMIDCCKKCKDSNLSDGMKVKKLTIKNGKIICPRCREELNGEVHIDI